MKAAEPRVSLTDPPVPSGFNRLGRFRHVGRFLCRCVAWSLLGAILAWSSAAVVGWIAPTPYTFFKFLQTPGGVSMRLGPANPTDATELLPITNADGSISGIGVNEPKLLALPSWPDGSIVHARAGELPTPPAIDQTPRVEKRYYADVYGWPLGSAAIIYSKDVGVFQTIASRSYDLEMGLELKGWRTAYPLLTVRSSLRRAIPICPWPGIFIDGPLHGLGVWLLVYVVRAFRGKVRRRRGLCPLCAYPTVPTGECMTMCPECGWQRSLPT